MISSLSTLALEQYLHQHIPLSKAMEVSAVSVAIESVVLSGNKLRLVGHSLTR